MYSNFLKYLLIIIMGMGLSLNAQPPINQWYDFGKPQSLINSIISTDSCYYASGIVSSDITPGIADFVFVKFDLNGTILLQKFLHSDTNWIHNGSADLIQTYDTNFVTILDYDKYFMFAKFNPQGDTICTGMIKEFYDLYGHEAVQCNAIVENPEDSTYTSLVCIQNETDFGSYIGLINTSIEGNINFYQFYPLNLAGYILTYPRSLIKTPDGYLISCDIIKDGSGSIDDSQRVRLIKVDESGNEQWRWTDMANSNDLFPFGLTQTSDGGYLYGGNSGWYNSQYNGHFYVGRITKLNTDLSLDWEIEMGDSTGVDHIRFGEIKDKGNGRYVATGFSTTDSMNVGWLINFDEDGQVHWDSYFSYVPSTIGIDKPWHELNDLELTSDNGFIMAGYAWDVEATNSGISGSFGWLIKTDSVGCLVPGCQDFLESDEFEGPQIKLSLYPNPASNILNIYFNDPSFSGKGFMQVYDLQGRFVKEWPLHSNDITYLYDVSTLTTGTYFLKVVENGIEKGVSKFVKQ